MMTEKLKVRVAALEKALLEIAEWKAIPVSERHELAVGEVGYYKTVALKALYPNPIKVNEE